MEEITQYKCTKCGYRDNKKGKCSFCGKENTQEEIITVIKTTTCQREDCWQYKTCNYNVYKSSAVPKDCEGYMSQSMAIYKNYSDKCKARGEEPMPYNIYFYG